MTKVKLTKKVDEYGRINWCHLGTEFLPPCRFVGPAPYTCWNYETGEYIATRELRTLREVREFIASYDETVRLEREAARKEEEARVAGLRAEELARIAAYKEYTSVEVEPQSFAAGDFIISRFARLNKNNTLEEYVYRCQLPEFTGERVRGNEIGSWVELRNWDDDVCKIEQVIEVSADEFDKLCLNLMDSDTVQNLGIEAGGHGSDELPDDFDFFRASEEDRRRFSETSYRLVALVTAPGRHPIVIDTQGYTYARYVGLFPRKSGE